jgi:hypothetical protein
VKTNLTTIKQPRLKDCVMIVQRPCRVLFGERFG